MSLVVAWLVLIRVSKVNETAMIYSSCRFCVCLITCQYSSFGLRLECLHFVMYALTHMITGVMKPVSSASWHVFIVYCSVDVRFNLSDRLWYVPSIWWSCGFTVRHGSDSVCCTLRQASLMPRHSIDACLSFSYELISMRAVYSFHRPSQTES